MSRRTSVERATTARIARTSDVRRDLPLTAFSDEVGDVVSFIRSQRDATTIAQSVNERQRRFTSGAAACDRERRLGDQTASIRHQNVAMIA